MDDGAGRSGIQSLRVAEEEASQLVSQARQARAARMKQAKAEAEKEIASFRQQQEARLESLREQQSALDDSAASLDAETQAAISAMSKECSSNQEQVINMLMEVVKKVQTEVPVARKGL